MMFLRNILFYFGIILATTLITFIGLAFFFLPYRCRYWIITRWSHFFIFWAKVTCGLTFKIEGKENLPKQNALVFSNHQSAYETILMQVVLPPQSWILKKELLYIPIWGWGLWLIEPIAINRKESNSIRALLKKGKEKLQASRYVIIFPEGTRVPPGEEKRFTRSGAALASASGYPVVLIAHNAGLFWPKGFFIKKPGVVRFVIGPTIDTKDKTTQEINEISETWIKSKVSELLKTE